MVRFITEMDDDQVFKANDLYDSFVNQDYENDYFDFVFHVEGRELYAHCLILAQHSAVFNRMFITNRSSRNEPMILDDYSYDEFFEFLRLFYQPDIAWDIPHKFFLNVIELADVYEVDRITDCFKNSEVLFKTDDIEEMFTTMEFAYKLSLKGYDLEMVDLGYLFSDIVEYDGFVHLDRKAFEVFLFYAAQCTVVRDKPDELCKAAYKWAAHRAMISEEMTEKEKNKYVLNEIGSYLKDLDFERMSTEFLFEFAIKKDFISIEELIKNVSAPHCRNFDELEKLCKAVYEWGKHQAMVNSDELTEKAKNERVLNEIKDLISLLPFRKISIKFLDDFVVKKNLISIVQARKFKRKYVQIQIKYGQTLDGSFIDEYGISDYALKSKSSIHLFFQNKQKVCCKSQKFKIPSTPSTVQKMKGCEWYLLLEKGGILTVKHESMINKKDDYLIAELKSKQEFTAFENKSVCLHIL